jgi:hypothetical protein
VDVLHRDFRILRNSITALTGGESKRKYYREAVFTAADEIQHKLSKLHQRITAILTHIDVTGFKQTQLRSLNRRVLTLSRRLQDEFLLLLPSAATTTPEASRVKTEMKAASGHIMAMLGASFSFRAKVRRLLLCMSSLHLSICSTLDRMSILYRISVSPAVRKDWPAEDLEDTEEEDMPTPTPEERVESFANGVGKLLRVEMSPTATPVDKLGLVERELKKVLQSNRLPPFRRPGSPQRRSATGLSPFATRPGTRAESPLALAAARKLPPKAKTPTRSSAPMPARGRTTPVRSPGTASGSPGRK